MPSVAADEDGEAEEAEGDEEEEEEEKEREEEEETGEECWWRSEALEDGDGEEV